MKKQLYCRYDPAFDGEKSIGALRIYLPTNIGYINYNIAHSVDKENTCDIWRLSYVYALDDDLKNGYVLNPTAEWDMALRIRDRDDFIGGVLHGDEIFTDMSLLVDGTPKNVTELTEIFPFTEIRMQVDSVGYDPADHMTPAINHSKEYVISSQGVAIEQRVEWLGDYSLHSCYMAMMPPLKAYTDSYYTDVDPTVREITRSKFIVENCKSATLFGKQQKLLFRMSIPKYPFYKSGNQLRVTDNSGRPYNKMYFPVCLSEEIRRGEIWETRTEYVIENG